MRINLPLVFAIIILFCLFSEKNEIKKLKKEVNDLKASQVKQVEFEYKIVNGVWVNVPVIKVN